MNSFDLDKAVNAVSYIDYTSPHMIDIYRIIFLADTLSLRNYGRLICGNTYKISNGKILPVELLDKVGDYEIPCIPDINFLSESDLECIDEVMDKTETYDNFYNQLLADNLDGILPIERIISSFDCHKILLSHYNETKNIDKELVVKILNLMTENPEDYRIIFKTFVMTLQVQMYSNRQINEMTNIVSNEFIKIQPLSVNFFNLLKKDVV